MSGKKCHKYGNKMKIRTIAKTVDINRREFPELVMKRKQAREI